jgi:hypothetical protein
MTDSQDYLELPGAPEDGRGRSMTDNPRLFAMRLVQATAAPPVPIGRHCCEREGGGFQP